MATSLRKELSYDADPDAVNAMLTDPSFREAVLAHQHVLRGSAQVEGERVTVEQVQSAAGLPSFARKFVGDEIAIVQVETWTSDSHADVTVALPGKPGDMSGTLDLAQVGDDVVQTVQLTVKVGIPLVGGKLEDFVAGLLSKAYRAENTVGLTWLSRD